MATALTVAKTVTRVLQALFAIICLGCASFWADLFKGLVSFGPISFAIIAGVTGLLVSVLLGIAPRFKKLAKLPGLPDCIISAVWSIFFLAVGASLANFGTCAAGGGMVGAGSMSRLALMFGGGSTSTFTSGTNGGTLSMSNTDLSLAASALNDLANQFGGLTVGGARHLLHRGRSEALRVALGRKAAPSVADVVGVTRRQLLGSMLGSALMNPQVLCGTWDAVVACGFINFVLYAASAVMAFLEWRASKKAAPATQVQVAKPASAAQPAAQPAAPTAAPTAA